MIIQPGSKEWDRLKDPRDRFKVLTDLMRQEAASPLPRYEMYETWARNREAYRAAVIATLGASESRPWDAANNVSVSLNALGRARRYQRRFIQRHLNAWVQAKRAAGQSFKLVIPKARRGGITTECAVETYLEVARGRGETALIVAQSDKDAEKIFRKTYKFIHENDPLAPIATKDNREELVFPSIYGSINIRSASGRKAAERGSESTIAQFTEPAHWEGDPYELCSSIVAAQPKNRVTAVFAESTGNGQAGWFYETCINALKKIEARELGVEPEIPTDWDILFYPWFMREEAIVGLPFESEEERDRFERGMRDDEKVIQQEQQLTLEQMKWYRKLYTDAEKEGGHDARLMFVLQEHPTKVLDCFQAPGSSAFDMARLVSLTLKTKAPIWQGDIKTPGARPNQMPLYDIQAGKWLTHTPLPKLDANPAGALRIWKRPVEGHRYYWGWDLAESGAAKADSTEGYCIDADTEELVAHYIDKASVNYTLAPCRMLSRYYNDAIINIESNSLGGPFIGSMMETDRLPFLFYRLQDSESATADHSVKEYGSKTNKYTKRTYVYLVSERLETTPGFFIDKHLIDQLKTFKRVRTPSGEWLYPGAVAGSGTHDDGVIAFSLALVAMRDRPPLGPSPVAKAEKPVVLTIRDAVAGHRKWEEEQNQWRAW